MKILMVGLHSGWMGEHLAHFCSAFQKKDIEVIKADYHRMGRLFGFLKVAGDAERRNRALEKLVIKHKPDVVLFVSGWNFDLLRLKSYFNGTVAVYDYDGPRRKNTEEYLSLFQGRCDLFLTVSRRLQRELKEQGRTAVYLPHGVDTDYYAPRAVSPAFASPLSYVGRTTERRIELCAGLRQYGLALYGERWLRSAECRKNGLSECVGMRRDVRQNELVDIYSSSHAVLNILQEPLQLYQTILSIQCFAIPASASCLIAEYVEELPDAFEPGKEVLCFRTPEELAVLSEKCSRDPEFARAVGKAGRSRCLAEHQWKFRADAFLQALGHLS